MKKLPFLAVVLMVAGVLPFVLCSAGIVFFDSGVPVPNLLMMLVTYGAVSLSFMGAVHWGQALQTDRLIMTAGADGVDNLRLALGVVPALVGWSAACLAYAWVPLAGIALLIAAFAGMVVCERAAWRRGWLPAGYMGARWIVTAVTECCLIMVLVVRAF
ncbi:MAG: DUF3429 domain-containing protein [Acetobacter sp.]